MQKVKNSEWFSLKSYYYLQIFIFPISIRIDGHFKHSWFLAPSPMDIKWNKVCYFKVKLKEGMGKGGEPKPNPKILIPTQTPTLTIPKP